MTTSRAKAGSGSIRKRPSTVEGRPATYTAIWSEKDRATGNRVQRSKGGFEKQKDAQTYLRERLTDAAQGASSTSRSKRWTVNELMSAWLLERELADLKASTLAGYRITVAAWITPRIGGTRIDALTTESVNAWLADLSKTGSKTGGPLSPRTVQLSGVMLRMALNYAVRVGRLRTNVAADATFKNRRPVKPKLTVWEPEEAAKFGAAVASDRLGAMYLLGLARGMRRGELCGLKWAQVNLDAGYLRVSETRIIVGGTSIQTSTPKTGVERLVPLDPRLVDVLRAHRTRQKEERLAAGAAWEASGYCFTMEHGAPVKPDHASDKFKRLCKAAGVRVINLHGLRHGVATYMLQAGENVKVVAAILGHSDASVTLRTYAHVLEGATKSAGDALSTALGI